MLREEITGRVERLKFVGKKKERKTEIEIKGDRLMEI